MINETIPAETTVSPRSLRFSGRDATILNHTVEIVSAMLAAGQLNASKPEGDAQIVASALKTIFTTLDDNIWK